MRILSVALLIFLYKVGVCAQTPAASPGITEPLGPVLDFSLIKAAAFYCDVKTGSQFFNIRYRAGAVRPSVFFELPTRDLSRRVGLSVDIKNLGKESVRVYGELNDNMWSSGYVLIPPKSSRNLYIFIQRIAFKPSSLAASFQEMNGIPGGQMKLWPEAEIDASEIRSMRIYLVAPRRPAQIRVSQVQPFGPVTAPRKDTLDHDFFPFIDRYGQLKHKEWAGKVHSDSGLKTGVESETADLTAHPEPPAWDRFGGWRLGPQLKASGHFRAEKVLGKWWLIDPDGHLFWSHGIDLIRSEEPTSVEKRETYFEDPAPRGDFLARNLELKYGSGWNAIWTSWMVRRLPSWGFNTIGDASQDSIIETKSIPYTVLLWSGPEGTSLRPESAEWDATLRHQMTEAAKQINDDPWCIGFFVDNEIHETDEVWWTIYYRNVSALAKKLIPNKLYLGSRLDFHDWPNSSPERYAIVRLAAKYTDVISFNQYRYTFEDFSMPVDIDRPLIVSEFHFGALDRGSLHTGLRSVVDQQQRGEAYEHFVNTALENPTIVGAHWFQLYDEPTTGRGDGENYQIGLLDICDQPYSETISAARQVAARMYFVRMNSGRPSSGKIKQPDLKRPYAQ